MDCRDEPGNDNRGYAGFTALRRAFLNGSMASRASWSARSFSAWPAWPRTQRQSTSWAPISASRRCHSSAFLTGCPAGGAPAVAPPVVDPAGDAVPDVFGVGMDLDLAAALERLERGDRRHQLHAVVGGHGLAARQLLLGAAGAQYGAPAAGARIARAGAVGEDVDRVRVAHAASCPASLRSSRGSLNDTDSSRVRTVSTVTSKRASKASTTSVTSTSGAEAPAVMPTLAAPSK
jgi:hypothetical protein